jgi:shikimate 5-dehydrogenase
MLTAQAVAAEEIWQNLQVPEEILQKIAEDMEA